MTIAAEKLPYQPGQTVYHATFGEGVAESVEHNAALVNFRFCGKRKIIFEKLSATPIARTHQPPQPERRGRGYSGEQPATLAATAFEWVDPADIPPRAWLYGRSLIRGFVSVTVAPGGLGKSSLAIVEALAMVTGRELLGKWNDGPLRVWLWNLEDPIEELYRRTAAACILHNVQPADLGGRFFLDSGRDQQLRLAEQTTRNGVTINKPVVENVIAEIKVKAIDVLIVDPFVSSHAVTENDNNAIDAVAKEWGRIADKTNCAIHLIHHTRKTAGDIELTAESSRGGKALTDAARDVRVLNRMTESEGGKAGVENHRLYFRAASDKGNLAPPADAAEWYRLESVTLANGDSVGVPVAWSWPDPLADLTVDDLRKAQAAVAAGEWRADIQAKQWAGHAIGRALGIDTGEGLEKSKRTAAQKAGRAKVQGAMRIWLASGALVEVERNDSQSRPRKFIEVGEYADD